MNVDGMLPYENKVANYVTATKNHVAYKVVPYFYGNNLVCSGVLMQAKSIEDNGAGVKFCVFAYNTQPGVGICYKNGENVALRSQKTDSSKDQKDKASTPQTKQTAQAQQTYVLNTKSKVFHQTDCKSVSRMSEKNKSTFTGSREECIAQGYRACKSCDP